MKNFLRIMLVVAFSMLVFNLTMIDWNTPTQGDSLIALIGILASASAFVLVWILILSLKISAEQKGKKF